MNREDKHALNHISIHIANAKPSVHLAPLNSHLSRSQSRKFNSVNLSLNPAICTNKSDFETEENRKRHSETIDQYREHEIYFNRTKKYNYMKEIIDKYFEDNKKDKHIIKKINPESSLAKNFKTLVPKISRTKDEKTK
jgi:chromatin segregation and condensation protein Rec8/ScpA/Scc1 (kleisin family)